MENVTGIRPGSNGIEPRNEICSTYSQSGLCMCLKYDFPISQVATLYSVKEGSNSYSVAREIQRYNDHFLPH